MIIDCDAVYAEYLDKGRKWVKLKAYADALEESKKGTLAECIRDLGEMAYNRAEMLARCEPKYINHLANLNKAKEQAELAKVEYDATKVLWESRMCNAATERAEMKLV